MKLLLVSADPTLLALVRGAFRKKTETLIHTDDMPSALKLLGRRRPEILVIDDSKGAGPRKQDPAGWRSLILRLRQNRGDNPAFVILITDRKGLEPVRLGSIGGPDDILPCPFTSAELEARIRTGERIIRLELELRRRIRHLEEANRLIIKANEQMKNDLYSVAKIQTSLLPAVLPEVREIVVAWEYLPRMELAGDGLNVVRLDEHNIGFYVLDVSGIGTAAALLSVSLSRTLSPFPAQSDLLKVLVREPPGYRLRSPGEVLGLLNSTFPLDLETKQFFTIFYGILHIPSGVLRYSSAGHPNPILQRTGKKPESVAGGGFPVGFVSDAEFEEFSIRLLPEDRLFIFSDGLCDARNRHGETFGKARFRDLIVEHRKRPLKEALGQVLAESQNWCRPKGLEDDVSILALEMVGSRKGR